jgi:hypothetical protein
LVWFIVSFGKCKWEGLWLVCCCSFMTASEVWGSQARPCCWTLLFVVRFGFVPLCFGQKVCNANSKVRFERVWRSLWLEGLVMTESDDELLLLEVAFCRAKFGLVCFYRKLERCQKPSEFWEG